MATARVPVPIVVTSTRNRALNPLNVLTERRFARRTARVLANSEGVRRELVSLAFVPADKIQIIHNFIDLDRFRPPTPEERVQARARWNIAPGDIALLVPGRISWQKHQLGVALALGEIRRAGQLPANVRLLLAGRRYGRLYGALLDPWLKMQGIYDRVTHLGTVTDMVSLYQAADVAVLPSLWEGLPNAVLEALACGLPAVVSHAANIDGIVTEGAGFEVPTFADDALAEALARITALSDGERRLMGERGRAHIAENFSATRVLGEMIDVYDRLLADAPMPRETVA
jgi:glycosyltransferase involved in cell wall biosynthesis